MDIKQAAIDILREWFPEGSTAYCIVRHVARSGMSRVIGLVCIRPGDDGKLIIRHPNWTASVVLGWRVDKARDGIHVSGCGMDMGVHLVSTLAYAMYGRSDALEHVWL